MWVRRLRWLGRLCVLFSYQKEERKHLFISFSDKHPTAMNTKGGEMKLNKAYPQDEKTA